jgi:hypothetical protein
MQAIFGKDFLDEKVHHKYLTENKIKKTKNCVPEVMELVKYRLMTEKLGYVVKSKSTGFILKYYDNHMTLDEIETEIFLKKQVHEEARNILFSMSNSLIHYCEEKSHKKNIKAEVCRTLGPILKNSPKSLQFCSKSNKSQR